MKFYFLQVLAPAFAYGEQMLCLVPAKEGMDKLMEGRTVFVIAHRLSTIVNCDKIFVLENGKISDEGKHQELLKSNKYYKKFT